MGAQFGRRFHIRRQAVVVRQRQFLHDAVAFEAAPHPCEHAVVRTIRQMLQITDDDHFAAAPRMRHVHAVCVVHEADAVFAGADIRHDDDIAFTALEAIDG